MYAEVDSALPVLFFGLRERSKRARLERANVSASIFCDPVNSSDTKGRYIVSTVEPRKVWNSAPELSCPRMREGGVNSARQVLRSRLAAMMSIAGCCGIAVAFALGRPRIVFTNAVPDAIP